MHVEHSAECQTLPGEPPTRQMEHFLHQTPPSKACAKVAPPLVLLLTCCVVLLSCLSWFITLKYAVGSATFHLCPDK